MGRCRFQTRRRWRQRSLSANSSHPGDQISVGVHTLLICDVIPMLRLVSVYLSCACARSCTDKKSGTSADRRSTTGVSRGCTEDCADTCSYSRADCCSCNGVLINCLLRRKSDSLTCPISAHSILCLELIKRFAGAW